jgi:hypothetical protein
MVIAILIMAGLIFYHFYYLKHKAADPQAPAGEDQQALLQ